MSNPFFMSVLRMLSDDGSPINVDIVSGTEDYRLVKLLNHLGCIALFEHNEKILEIGITPKGIKYRGFLDKHGY